MLAHEQLHPTVPAAALGFAADILHLAAVHAVQAPALTQLEQFDLIGQQAGTSLIVARYGMNSAKEVDVSVHRFEQNRVEIKGAILNAIERRASNEYGYYAYHYNSDKS